jgi:hypothetical protein
MKTYAIDNENNLTIHPTRQAALETGSGLFSTQAQFADLIGTDNKRLVEIWNRIPGVTAVKKFTDRKTATGRIWKAIQSLGDPLPAPASKQPKVASLIETPLDTGVAPAPIATTVAEHVSAPVANETAAEPDTALPATVAPQEPDVAQPETQPKHKATRRKKAPPAPTNAKGARTASKTETILALMKQPGGTTLHAIMEATGWQAHSVRGFISGTLGKKMGLTVVSTKTESGGRSYSIQA